MARAKKNCLGSTSGPPKMARDGSGSPKTPSGRASGRVWARPIPNQHNSDKIMRNSHTIVIRISHVLIRMLELQLLIMTHTTRFKQFSLLEMPIQSSD